MSEMMRSTATYLLRFGKVFGVVFLLTAMFHFISIYPLTKTLFTVLIAFVFVYLIIRAVGNCLKVQVEKIELDKDLAVLNLISSLNEEFKNALIDFFKNGEFEKYEQAKIEKTQIAEQLKNAQKSFFKLKTQNSGAEKIKEAILDFEFCRICWQSIESLGDKNVKVESQQKTGGNSPKMSKMILRKNQSANNLNLENPENREKAKSLHCEIKNIDDQFISVCKNNCFLLFFVQTKKLENEEPFQV